MRRVTINMVASKTRRSNCDQNSPHGRVLIRVASGAHTMIAVCNDKGSASCQIALNQNDWGECLAPVDALQILGHVPLLRWQERQIAGSQDVLGDMLGGLDGARL